jgi:hypothetical protein
MARVHQMATPLCAVAGRSPGKSAPTSVLPVITISKYDPTYLQLIWRFISASTKRFSDLAVFNARFYIQVRRVDEPF